MNTNPFLAASRIAFLLLCSISLFSCVSNETSSSEEEEEMQRVADIDLIRPVAMSAISGTAAALTTALSTTIDSAGIQEAILYCNLNANNIVRDLSDQYGLEIKRTSLQLRNASNKPTADEKLILDFYAKQESLDKDCVGEMSKIEGVYKYYHPIYVMENCTACHGVKGKTMNKKAAKKIAELYPSDQATGYEAGDLRGMWVVSFKK